MTNNDVNDLKKIYRKANEEYDYPKNLKIELVKESDLRYGENPNQPAALYKFKGSSIAKLTNLNLLKSGKGGLSGANLMDVTRAIEILKYFQKPSCAVMKHCIPSGFATQDGSKELVEIYKKARDADARSSFGCLIVFNTKVDKKTAKEIMTSFVEAVAAPQYEDEAVEILSEKRSMRLISFENFDKIPKFEGDNTNGIFDLKVMATGRIVVQTPYLTKIKSGDYLVRTPTITTKQGEKISVNRKPTSQEEEDLLTSWYVNLGVRSNGIVIVKDGVTLAVGSGQQERVGAVEQAIQKAYQKEMDRQRIKYEPMKIMDFVDKLKKNPLKGAVISSDGFFPFRDSIDLLAKVGITAVIQPGGSINDSEVIKAVNENEMSMVFTTERCFGHF
ncbi:IMP cyclohydrolase [Candidatus Woesearchaeota archaeon]|nr:IMP cyclohydrolase [Candidatus Woesearchaeota archaeon]